MVSEALWWLVLGVLVGWIASWAVARGSLRAVMETASDVGAPVERIIERPIDNPALVARVAELEQQTALIDDLREQIRTLEAMRPPADLPADAIGLGGEEQDAEAQRDFDRERIETLNLEVVEWRERFVDLERRAAEQQAIIAALEQKLATAEAHPLAADLLATTGAQIDRVVPAGSSSQIDLAAAQAAGFDLMGAESLEIIEGIGTRIAAVLSERGVRTLGQLAEMTGADVRAVLDTAGPNLRLVNPSSWPAQAALAVTNRWDALAGLQQALMAQKRRDTGGG